MAQDISIYFRSLHDDIRKNIRYLSKKYGIPNSDADDIGQEVSRLLIENDYEKTRKLVDKSRFYITATIRNLFVDIIRSKRKREGVPVRFRNSVEAEKLGKSAVELERLLYKDGYSFREAAEIFLTHSNPGITENELQKLYAKLPKRNPLPSRDENIDPDQLAARSPAPDATLVDKEMDQLKQKMESIVDAMKKDLTGEDLLLLKMRYEGNETVSAIARVFREERNQMERRLGRILSRFKEGILAQGINIDDAMDVIHQILGCGERNE